MPPPNALSVDVTVTQLNQSPSGNTAAVAYAIGGIPLPGNKISINFRPPGSPQACMVTLNAAGGVAAWGFSGPGTFSQAGANRVGNPSGSGAAIRFVINRGTSGGGRTQAYHAYSIVSGGLTYAVDPMIEIDD